MDHPAADYSSALHLVEPREPSPVVIEVPHASTWIEAEASQYSSVQARCAAFDADLYVDELFADAPAAGATLVVARASRYVIDLNVAPFPLERDVLGVPQRVRRISASGRRWVDESPPAAELERRRAVYFRPYHDAITSVLERKRERFGVAVLLCAHSYLGRSGNGDLVIGTRGDTTAEPGWANLVADVAETEGLRVARDDPFPGGYAVRRHADPERGIHAMQLEFRRSLYMDRTTLARDETGGFVRTRTLATQLIHAVVERAHAQR